MSGATNYKNIIVKVEVPDYDNCFECRFINSSNGKGFCVLFNKFLEFKTRPFYTYFKCKECNNAIEEK